MMQGGAGSERLFTTAPSASGAFVRVEGRDHASHFIEEICHYLLGG